MWPIMFTAEAMLKAELEALDAYAGTIRVEVFLKKNNGHNVGATIDLLSFIFSIITSHRQFSIIISNCIKLSLILGHSIRRGRLQYLTFHIKFRRWCRAVAAARSAQSNSMVSRPGVSSSQTTTSKRWARAATLPTSSPWRCELLSSTECAIYLYVNVWVCQSCMFSKLRAELFL